MDLLNPAPVVGAAAIEGQVDGRSPVHWGRFFIGRHHHLYAFSEKQPWVPTSDQHSADRLQGEVKAAMSRCA
jgi:hypothetical protein